ncbi:uncharacterized protein STEHIDRAFT_156562 [Stereum hirsutum FP-91666 SS1]|uniref:uncharacterized protein n=1 Tax=Stereum hirsutum (strain FP-91666) TaxID=721885 RepID=UPI000440C4F0|nr:uncharacterized protein STEHIDRAFT_156562 [Stereum hirsutum FP-91666 SS1]EIM87608.1 hypothetical protein STEHIDRAFT_156562 [Stereum hirsutum FP-91666 SS1]
MDDASIRSQLVTNYTLSSIYFSILFYDYIITFSSEVQHFWLAPRNKAAWPSILFFLTRYLTLFGHVLLAIEVFMFPVNDTWVICTGVSDGPPELLGIDVPGCNPLHPAAQSRRLALPWALLLVFDFAIFALTAFKAFENGLHYPKALMRVLLRDGALYFIVLFCANLSNVLMYLYASPLLKDTNTVLSNVLSTTLICRLMINLREENAERTDSSHLGGPNRIEAVSLPAIEFRASESKHDVNLEDLF